MDFDFDSYLMVGVTPRMAQRIIDFMDYLDTAVNLEPAGPSRNKDFHMATECREIREALNVGRKKSSADSL